MTGGRPVSAVAATGSLDDGDDAAGPVLAGEALGDPGGALAVLGLGHGPPYRRGQALGRQPAERLGPRADPERGQPLGPGLPAHRVGREPVAGDLEPGPPVVGPGDDGGAVAVGDGPVPGLEPPAQRPGAARGEAQVAAGPAGGGPGGGVDDLVQRVGERPVAPPAA